MRNRYAEVFRSYFTHLNSTLVLRLLIPVMLLVSLLFFVFPHRMIADHTPIFMMALIFVYSFLWGHFKEQIVTERSKLCPNYLHPHILIFTVISLCLILLGPAFTTLNDPRDGFALMAIATVSFALIGWCIIYRTWFSIVLLVGFYFSVSILGASGPIYRYTSLPAVSIGISLLALLASALAILRGVLLTDESPAYSRFTNLDTWSLRSQMTGDVSRNWKSAQQAPGYKLFTGRKRAHIPTTSGIFNRSKRWRSLLRGQFFMVFAICGFSLLWTSIICIYSHVPQSVNSPLLIMWLFMMPSLNVSQAILRQWRYLETDFLRPLNRETFLREMGFAMMIQIFQIWVILAVGHAAISFLISGTSMDILGTAQLLACSLAIQVFAFGSTVWLMRGRSIGSLLLAAFIPAIFGMAVFIPNEALRPLAPLRPYLLVVAFGMALIGVFITRDAYRRWLITEIG